MDRLWQLSACEAVSMLKAKQVTPLQLVEAAEARWKETEPLITAMPITCWERAKAQAQALMAEGFPDPVPSKAYLYGLPVAVKDLTAVKGLPFTLGCKLFRDRIAEADDPLVQQLQLNGAIIVGKTNTPELGAGSQTFNEVFGTTLNPWDTTKTVGGSSGGSAAAVAVGQVWLATGTDLGGSLRNPASFCGVVGLRPSIGLIPQEQPPSLQVKDLAAPQALLQSVSGIIARTVHDLALGLDAAAGQTEQDAWSLPAPEPPLAEAVAAGFAPRSVAFTPNLGGITPIDPEVAQICRHAAGWWQQQGAQLTEVSPDLRDAPRAFEVLRAFCFRDMARQYSANPAAVSVVKKDLVWQMQQALAISQEQIDWAVAAHGRLVEEMRRFFKQHDLLLCPTVMLPPFDAATPWISEFQGVKLDTYIAWMVTCSAISVVGTPAVSCPCGTTASGLPVGLQVVGPPGEDGRVLAAAAAFEASHRHALATPMDVVVKK